MVRLNYKHKRLEKTTIFACVEGETEEAFLKHLKFFYCRNNNVQVKVKIAKRIDKIIRCKKASAYVYTFYLRDNDVQLSQKSKEKAKKNKIEIIEIQQCIEKLFLLILNHKFKCKSSNSNNVSDLYKKEFEKKYLDKKKKLDWGNYKKIFPKKLLEKKRKKIPNLNKIISIMISVKNKK